MTKRFVRNEVWLRAGIFSAPVQETFSRAPSSDARSFFIAIAAACDLPQWHIDSSSGRNDSPNGVTE